MRACCARTDRSFCAAALLLAPKLIKRSTSRSRSGLAIASAGVFGWGKLVVAGIFMGVTGMHYTGMAALLMPADIHYDMALVGASAAISIFASIVALWLAFNLRGWVQMLGSALAMGVAVCGMHYTGMQQPASCPTKAARRHWLADSVAPISAWALCGHHRAAGGCSFSEPGAPTPACIGTDLS